MPLASVLRRFAAPASLAVATAFTAANDAQAAGLIPGQCYTKMDAEAVLKQEEQAPVIVGERTAVIPVTPQNPSGLERNANVFFMNRQGYGYNIEGDRPLGTPSTKLCARAAYKDGVLNDPNSPEIPNWGRDIKTNGNIDVVKAYQMGARLLMAAQTFTPQTDGSEKVGKHIVVLLETKDQDHFGVVWAVNADGLPNTNFVMEKTGITKQMTEMFAK